MAYAVGDELEVEILKIVPRGLGLGFVDRLTVFVSLAAPGDRLRVRIKELKKRVAFAEIVEVIQGGASRTAPPCPYFGTCGGCDFQQMSYDAQLAAKVDIIRDCLHRIGKIDEIPDIAVIPSPSSLAYRSRVRWHVDRTTRRIGYFARGSHDIIDIDHCPKITDGLNATLRDMRSEIEWESFWSDQFDAEAAEGDDGAISLYSTEFAESAADVSARIGDHVFTYTAQTFFQANRLATHDLVSAAIGDLSGELALDLYCGVGLFALPLSERFASVVAIEEFAPAIDSAGKNVRQNGISNVELRSQGVERYLIEHPSIKPDLVLLDPPRSGTEKRTISLIAKLQPKHISYVSCDPSVLARDVRVLIDSGYRISSISALDLFPQTHHVETVMHLTRRG